MHEQISSGTLDAPSWKLIRSAKMAARMYAPIGTEMTLGDYVRVVRTFLEAFKLAEATHSQVNGEGGPPLGPEGRAEDSKILQLCNDIKVGSCIPYTLILM